MGNDTFNAVRSISAAVRESIAAFIHQTGNRPKEIHVHPSIYDAWRAELLATGKIKPKQPFYEFDGIRVEPVNGVSSAELK
jgi:hypothetical protein